MGEINGLRLTVSNVHPLSSGGRLKAFADLQLNDAIEIKGLRIVESNAGLFVSMPQEQGKDNRWYDRVRCSDRELRTAITDVVIEAYQGAVGV